MSDALLINNLLNQASERKATDIHMVAGANPVIRVDGRLVSMTDAQILTPDLLSNIAASMLTQEDMAALEKEREVTTVYSWANRARYRVRVFYQKGYLALSMRLVPPFIRSPKDLGISPAITRLLTHDRGLIIITGPYNSGRTTTAASLIETINQNKGLHIQTLERPIEYLFINNQSIIEQREVGKDTPSFSKGMADILDADVDVLFIGSLYEEGMEKFILELAESGKLVILIMDSDSAVSALDRFISNVEPEKRSWAQDMLSECLLGVTAQRLLPRVGGGLSLATEVLTMTSAVRSSIKDNKLFQLSNIMQTSREEGMISLDKSLAELVQVGEISAEDAKSQASGTQNLKQSYR